MITPSSADSQCLNTDHNLMEHRVEHKGMSDEGQTITTDTHGFAQTTHTHKHRVSFDLHNLAGCI